MNFNIIHSIMSKRLMKFQFFAVAVLGSTKIINTAFAEVKPENNNSFLSCSTCPEH